jgi:hypothetical protein
LIKRSASVDEAISDAVKPIRTRAATMSDATSAISAAVAARLVAVV